MVLFFFYTVRPEYGRHFGLDCICLTTTHVLQDILAVLGRHFVNDIFHSFSLIKFFCILIKISHKFVPKGPGDNTSIAQIMAWRRTPNMLAITWTNANPSRTGECAIWDICLKPILNLNLTKSRSSIRSVSIVQSFWNSAQSTAVSQPCSVQNFKMIG